ncbi:FecR family protein [Parapedobacter deserti]|uniref:FecR family protein n=1 Tax=Parapedobacter deserti TaxID=1912957 RepID=A0ABV7JN86_9SPHI
MKKHSPLPLDEIRQLLSKYLQGNCTAEEEQRVLNWYYSFGRTDDVRIAELQYKRRLDSLKNNVLGKIGDKPAKPKHLMRPFAIGIAALVVMAIGISMLLFRYDQAGRPDLVPNAAIVPDETGKHKNDILPGGYYAQVVFENGRTVAVTDSGELDVSALVSTGEPAGYRTVNVPKTATFRVKLSDGSIVWLNSLSSLRYPENFGSDERQVYLEGEAYFEVAKEASRPFRVKVAESTIEVLGTSFNVKAYGGQVSAALVEGSIKVISRDVERMVVPGEEAVISREQILVERSDIRKQVAWKDGDFFFKKDGLPAIMEQISRWYNVDIVYEGDISSGGGITGSIGRSARLSDVLTMLSNVSDLQFDIDERTVTVRK